MQELGSERALPPDLERAVVRIVGEALRNVAQHAQAKSATVTLSYGADGVVVTVADDGTGFDAQATREVAEAQGHFGLVGMRERAEAVGGALAVQSAAGTGTMVTATIPYQASRVLVGAAPDPEPAAEPVRQRGLFARMMGR